MNEARSAAIAAMIEAMAVWPEVVAIAEGGSRATGAADAASDCDLYVYVSAEVPVARRQTLLEARGRDVEIDNRFFETGDEWVDGDTGLAFDVMFRSPDWIETEIERVVVRNQASVGYSTCLWHNVRTSRPRFDRTGWFASLQHRAEASYPEALARAVVAKNRPLLGDAHGAFNKQIAKAAARGDAVSVNHRTAAFLASAFDVLFALNRAPHPGEKRMLANAAVLPRVPDGFAAAVAALLAAKADDAEALESAAAAIAEGLHGLAAEQGL